MDEIGYSLGVASIRKRAPEDGGGYQVRYQGSDRKGHARTFRRKVDAQRFARSVEVDKDRGQWADPRLGKVTFGQFSQDWCEANLGRLKPSTRAGYESLLRTHLLPTFGPLGLSSLRRQDVERFLTTKITSGLSPSRTGQCLRLLKLILGSAVQNGYITVSPTTGVRAPRGTKREIRPLDASQIARLVAEIPPEYRPLVLTLAYTGIRWGEAVALRWERVDLERRRLEIRESASEIGGIHYGPTKAYAARSVPIPRFLADALEAHGESTSSLVFTTPTGRPIRNANFRQKVWLPALERGGLPPMRIHDLRHTCAALLISQGHSPKSIQAHLGHSSIVVTMDTYGHLYKEEQERIAASLDKVWADNA